MCISGRVFIYRTQQYFVFHLLMKHSESDLFHLVHTYYRPFGIHESNYDFGIFLSLPPQRSSQKHPIVPFSQCGISIFIKNERPPSYIRWWSIADQLQIGNLASNLMCHNWRPFRIRTLDAFSFRYGGQGNLHVRGLRGD